MRYDARSAILGMVLALVATLAGCAEDRTALDAELAAGRAAFEAGDASEATRIAREVLASHPDDAAVQQLAAVAAWMRGALGEALQHATRGIELADADDDDLRSSLHFVAGSAAAQRYTDLKDPRDWGLANNHLEDATVSGRQQVDAAIRLVQMHSSKDPRADRKRLLRFARLILSVEPNGKEADIVRTLAERMGLSL